MPQAESTAAPEIKKAIIIKDPKNGVLTIAIPMTSEGSESTEEGPMDTLVDFIQTFINPIKKSESDFWSKAFKPRTYRCRCIVKEKSADIVAEPETVSPETEPLKLSPEQELRLKCLESARSYAQHFDPIELTDIAGTFFKWVINGPLEETQDTSGKA